MAWELPLVTVTLFRWSIKSSPPKSGVPNGEEVRYSIGRRIYGEIPQKGPLPFFGRRKDK